MHHHTRTFAAARHPATRLITLVLIGITVVGCTVKDALEDITPTSFVQHPDLLRKPKNTPFSLAWVRPQIRGWQYDTLFVEAVRTDQIDLENWVLSTSVFLPTKESYQSKVLELADYIQEEISDAFDEYEKKSSELKVKKGAPVEQLPSAVPAALIDPDPVPPNIDPVDRPEKVLILSISIAQVDFGDPVIYGGLTAVPSPAAANLSTAVKSPSLTLEARFTDKQTGEVVAELVDRRFPQVKPLDVNRLTISSAVHELTDSFAADLVAAFYRKHGEKVGRRLPFSLIPW